MCASQAKPDSSELDSAIQSIDRLLDELADLSEKSVEPERFYQELLDRAVLTVDAEAAAVWCEGPGEQWVLASHSQAERVYPSSHHKRYREDREQIAELSHQTEPRSKAMRSAKAEPWVCCPITSAEKTVGILALYCSAGLNDAALRIHQQFVSALAELAEDFEKNRRVQLHESEVGRWKSLNACALAAYRFLDERKTAFELANEGRVYLQCDRVSIFRLGTTRTKLLATSGLATLDTRSELVRKLRALATKAAKTRETFYFREGGLEVPRSVRKPLNAFLRESNATQVIVIPLFAGASEIPIERRRLSGAAVIEVLSDGPTTDLLERSQLFSLHANAALARAIQYQSIPLRPIWMGIGWLLAQFGIRRIPVTLIVLAAIVGMILPLILVKTDFVIESRGELRPVNEKNVFASADGFVSELMVSHGKVIDAGDTVVQLESPELERELEEINGQLLVVSKKIGGLSLAVSQADPNDQESLMLQAQYSAEIEELKQREINLKEQRELVIARMNDLTLKSPIQGQIVTWQVERDLPERPVRQGESLMRVADVGGAWHLQLKVPDRKIGYVVDAQDEGDDPLTIEFVLETDPDRTATAKLVSIATSATSEDGEPAYVLVTAEFDKDQVGQLRPGTTVVARVHCGRRSLGYVWLHDMIDAVDRRFIW